jgi:hypothetical protein
VPNGPEKFAKSEKRNLDLSLSRRRRPKRHQNESALKQIIRNNEKTTTVQNQNQVKSIPAGISSRLMVPLLSALLLGMPTSANAQITWYSGQRAFGQATVEPAVDLATGNEIFLHTGDFNVAWYVVLVAFTPQGFADGAINDRILTLDQLNKALAVGDATPIGPVTSFDCSITSETSFLHGTPLTFTVP